MPNRKTPKMAAHPPTPPPIDLDTFAADAIDWIGDGRWRAFVVHMEGLKYTEAQVEDAATQIAKRAGRVG